MPRQLPWQCFVLIKSASVFLSASVCIFPSPSISSVPAAPLDLSVSLFLRLRQVPPSLLLHPDLAQSRGPSSAGTSPPPPSGVSVPLSLSLLLRLLRIRLLHLGLPPRPARPGPAPSSPPPPSPSRAGGGAVTRGGGGRKRVRDAAAASGGLRRLRPFVPAAGGWVRGAAAAEGEAGALWGRPAWPSPAQPARPCPAAGRARRRIHVRVRTGRGAGERTGGLRGVSVIAATVREPVHVRPAGGGEGGLRGDGGGGSGVQKGAERRRRGGPGLTGRCHGAMRRVGGAFTGASRAHTAGSAACGEGTRPGSPLSGRRGVGATLTGSLGLGWRLGGLTGRGPWGRPGNSPSGPGPPSTVLVCCESWGYWGWGLPRGRPTACLTPLGFCTLSGLGMFPIMN